MCPGMKKEDIDTEVLPGITQRKKNHLCVLAKFHLLRNKGRGRQVNGNAYANGNEHASDAKKDSTLTRCAIHNSELLAYHMSTLVHPFNPSIPIEKAVTPPTSWYTHPSFFHRVFYRG
ncbi:hypothetical protein VNO78_25464 [Psophocarpus tetragonolobus]|uniref:Uncharacterized protein n=1 Tax=Psophocarpus tetragonolobus TaxID=3891 RepID=A0AAN9XFC7_PSOTE